MSVVDSVPNGEATRWWIGRSPGVEDTGPFPGRHASHTEIAAETPIFHSLTVGEWRGRRHETEAPNPAPDGRHAPRADPLSEFRRDPLTAPIPIQAYAAPPTTGAAVVRQIRRAPAVPCASAPALPSAGAHALPERPARTGRHQIVQGRPGGHRAW
ncbi:MAG: hypothetical protein JWR81_4519 [Pseudonocardia sp.]|nr:hypothetical protein [Pseudonocardia sp.]MDT7615050.1 hypothetical protein [Pseudonocardiales bacterium]